MELQELFNKTTVVKPAANSSKFFRQNISNRIENPEQVVKGISETGEEVSMATSPFKGERFNDTKQLLGGRYNYSSKKWMIIDPLDITKSNLLKENSKALNILVTNCKLINERPDHPEKGKFITSADIFDRYDPFFTHSKVRYALEAGQAYIKSSLQHPLNVTILLLWLGRRDFQLGSSVNSMRKGTSVRYVVVDNESDKKHKQSIRNQDEKAREYYKALNDEQKLKVMMALGVVNSFNLPKETIDDYAYTWATDNITKPKKQHKTKQQLFYEMIISGKQVINAYYCFHLGKSKGIIRHKDQSYTAFGKKLGSTVTDSVTYISSDGNNLYQQIMDAVDLKKTTSDIKVKHENSFITIPNKADTFINDKEDEEVINTDLEQVQE